MNQSNEIVPVTNRGVVLAGGNVCDAVIRALDETRIPDSIQGTNRVDAERERVRQVLDIFAFYFTGGFRTFTRADVGRHIHPADTPMKLALSTYTKGALLLPPNERFACFTPLQFLLSAIGETWHDAETAALNVRACLDEVRDRVREHGTHPITKEAAAQWYVDFDKLKQTLRDELKALSAKLSDTSADHADNTQRTLSAIMQEIHAARGDIAAVGADAHAGRVAAEHAAHDAAAARGDIADSEERTQFVIHKGFEDMEPVKTGVAILVTKKHNRSRNGKAAQRKAKNDPEIQSAKKRAADDMHRALERVRDDPAVIAGNHGAVLTACRRLCDWKDDAGHVHHGKFEQLTTSKKYGEPQYAPLMDWQGNPIKPETLARNFRDARKAKPKLKRGKK